MYILNNKSRLQCIIYLYYFSIIFDAIFRKWILPSLSTPIMMIKQIIAVIIFFYGIKYLVHNNAIWEKASIIIGIIVFCTTLTLGHGNLIVALWGCTSFWFGIPVCYIISKALREDDILQIGKLTVYTSIVNSILIIVQFNLPTNHWLNYKGFEVQENIANLSAAELAGMFRPTGIFITSTHNSLFMLLSLAFILYFLIIKKYIIKQKLLYIALILFLTACLCTASRTNIIYSIGLVIYFLYFYIKKNNIKQFVPYIFISIISFIIIILSPIGKSATNNINKRFENASQVQYKGKSTSAGTLSDLYYRTIGYNIDAIISPKTIDGESIPFWGYGQGMSTQIGGKILKSQSGRSGFSLAEWDGLRIMCESGYILGWIIIFLRLGYVFRFFTKLFKYKRKNAYLPIIIYPSFLLSFYLLNTWGNAFLANFAFLTGGLFLASLKIKFNYSNTIQHQ